MGRPSSFSGPGLRGPAAEAGQSRFGKRLAMRPAGLPGGIRAEYLGSAKLRSTQAASTMAQGMGRSFMNL